MVGKQWKGVEKKNLIMVTPFPWIWTYETHGLNYQCNYQLTIGSFLLANAFITGIQISKNPKFAPILQLQLFPLPRLCAIPSRFRSPYFVWNLLFDFLLVFTSSLRPAHDPFSKAPSCPLPGWFWSINCYFGASSSILFVQNHPCQPLWTVRFQKNAFAAIKTTFSTPSLASFNGPILYWSVYVCKSAESIIRDHSFLKKEPSHQKGASLTCQAMC